MKPTRLLTFLLAGCLLITGSKVQGIQEVSKVRLEDDFYTAVNEEWLANAKIQPGYPDISNFTEASDCARSAIRTILEALIAEEDNYKEGSVEDMMIDLYNNYLNERKRNEEGIAPALPYLEKVRTVSTIETYTEMLSEPTMQLFNTLYGFQVAPDMKNSDKNALTIISTSLSLRDPDHYKEPTDLSQHKKEATITYLMQLFRLADYTEEEAKEKVKHIFQLEHQLALAMLGTRELTSDPNIYEVMYNVYTVKELEDLAPHIGLAKTMKALGVEKAHKIILEEPRWLEALNDIYIEENLPLLKDYTEAVILQSLSPYLSDDFVALGKDYGRSLYGIDGDLPREEEAIELINQAFSEEVGKRYVEANFSKEAKRDVERMAKKIIATYKKRLQTIDWMSDQTKKQATAKLNAMGIKIGYPNKWQDYKGLHIAAYEEGSNLAENIIAIQQYNQDKLLSKVNKAVDKERFLMNPQTINACYSMMHNDITFPAAILQPPFYDIHAKEEVNLGAIGVVIGHEITHAFDTAGARFDKDGNLKDWWTTEDYACFEEKANQVRSYYGQIEVLPGKYINGRLTVGENIADIGAMACLLDVMETIPNADYRAFFESWAKVWRSAATDKYRAELLVRDPHAPNKQRVNEVVKQFDEFYEVYEIEAGDGMYLPEEERIKIW